MCTMRRGMDAGRERKEPVLSGVPEPDRTRQAKDDPKEGMEKEEGGSVTNKTMELLERVLRKIDSVSIAPDSFRSLRGVFERDGREGRIMKVYLSHPYGGSLINKLHSMGIAKLYQEIWAAEGVDHEIVNPLVELEDEAENNTEPQMLALAIDLMRKCDAVMFAPGWKKSRGCRMEHMAAFADGMKICYLPEGLALS